MPETIRRKQIGKQRSVYILKYSESFGMEPDEYGERIDETFEVVVRDRHGQDFVAAERSSLTEALQVYNSIRYAQDVDRVSEQATFEDQFG